MDYGFAAIRNSVKPTSNISLASVVVFYVIDSLLNEYLISGKIIFAAIYDIVSPRVY